MKISIPGKCNLSSVTGVYVGNKKASAVYIGSKQIWPVDRTVTDEIQLNVSGLSSYNRYRFLFGLGRLAIGNTGTLLAKINGQTIMLNDILGYTSYPKGTITEDGLITLPNGFNPGSIKSGDKITLSFGLSSNTETISNNGTTGSKNYDFPYISDYVSFSAAFKSSFPFRKSYQLTFGCTQTNSTSSFICKAYCSGSGAQSGTYKVTGKSYTKSPTSLANPTITLSQRTSATFKAYFSSSVSFTKLTTCRVIFEPFYVSLTLTVV